MVHCAIVFCVLIDMPRRDARIRPSAAAPLQIWVRPPRRSRKLSAMFVTGHSTVGNVRKRPTTVENPEQFSTVVEGCLHKHTLAMSVDLGRVRMQLQTMVDAIIGSIPNLIVALVVLTVFLLLARVAKNFAIRTGKRYGHSVNLGLVAGRLIQWVVGLTAVLIAISVVAPSFQAKDLINMLGIGGLAVGFAF